MEICNGQGHENICIPDMGIFHTCQNIEVWSSRVAPRGHTMASKFWNRFNTPQLLRNESEQRPKNKSKEKLTCQSYKAIPIKKLHFTELENIKELIQYLKRDCVPYS